MTMRKTLITLVFVIPFFFISFSSFAQDRIITTDGRLITAKILEISDQVVYKEYDYQNGPTYRLPVSIVASITLENGTERVFHAMPEKIMYPSSIDVRRGDIYSNGEEIPEKSLPFVLGDDLYQSYKSGKSLRSTGKTLMIVGGSAAAEMGISGLILLAGIDEISPVPAIVCFALAGVGVATLLAGIPLNIVGNSKLSGVVNDYNQKHSPTLTIGLVQHGVGLALNF